MDHCDILASYLNNLSVSSPPQEESQPEEGQSCPEPENIKDCHPLLNDCILRTCFKYLPVKAVASCRLVSRFWNQAACSYLRQRALVRFKFAEEIYGFTNVMEGCTDCPYQRFNLHIFEHEIEHPLVRLLFDKFGSTMTSVTFDLQGNSRYAFKAPDPLVFKQLLDLPRIEEIRLYGLPDNILQESHLFDKSSFPLLRTFSFSIYQDKYGINSTSSGAAVVVGDELDILENHNNNNTDELLKANRALIFNIIDSGRNLQNLEIGSVNWDCAKILFRQGNLPRLTTFTTLSLNVSSLPTESLILLGDACPNLKHLSCFMDLSSTPEQVYQLLSKVPNLVYLKLRGGKLVRDLPVMGKLRELHLLMACGMPLSRLWADLPRVTEAHLMLSTAMIHQLYAEGDENAVLSPRLQSLQISHNHVQHASPFLGRIKFSFPGLTRLRLKATSEMIKDIFRFFVTLEELYIEDGSAVSDEDITGISADYLYADTEDQDDINVGRMSSYIGKLKHLKRLFLGSTFITNASIYYGLTDLRELTYLSLREPVELITGIGKRLPISDHIFSLYPLICHLSYLVRIELRESRCRSRTDDLPVILPEEISYIRALRPHLQLVYITKCTTSQGDEKITYF